MKQTVYTNYINKLPIMFFPLSDALIASILDSQHIIEDVDYIEIDSQPNTTFQTNTPQ